MLVLFNKKTGNIEIPSPTRFDQHNILERQHIERWIEEHPEILDEDLLILTTEYDKYDKTNERLDLLALDRNGNLVIVELKRDDSGKNVDIQAVKYAAYCSNLTLDDVIEEHQEYLLRRGELKSTDEIRTSILNFVDDSEFEQINDRPRIILLANNFRPEVTASVMWLRKFEIDIKCVRLIPYAIDEDTIGLEATTIIPIPEAEDYIIKAERKENLSLSPTITQKSYISFYAEQIENFQQRMGIVLNRRPGKCSYYSISSGINGIHYEWAFHGRPRSSFEVGLHFEFSDKQKNIDWLNDIDAKIGKKLEKTAGEKLVIQKDWGQRWSRIYFEKQEGQMTEELKSWATDKMEILYKTVQPYLESNK